MTSCMHCDSGHAPARLKRHWVHHFPDTGQLVVCDAHVLVPASTSIADEPELKRGS